MRLQWRAWVLVVMFPALAAGQMPLTGRVTDVNAAPLPGVSVTAVAAGPGERLRTAVTDASGRFTFAGVAAGVYTLTFALPGFQPLMRSGVTVAPDAAATVDATLLVGSLAETITLPGPPQSVAPRPQDGPECLHGPTETAAEAERREEAQRAMQVIYAAVERAFPRQPWAPLPTWVTLANAPAVESLKSVQGPVGELARRINWGAAEPLPGWRIEYIVTTVEIRFSLADVRDSCGFTLSSKDPRVIPPRMRIMPLT